MMLDQSVKSPQRDKLVAPYQSQKTEKFNEMDALLPKHGIETMFIQKVVGEMNAKNSVGKQSKTSPIKGKKKGAKEMNLKRHSIDSVLTDKKRYTVESKPTQCQDILDDTTQNGISDQSYKFSPNTRMSIHNEKDDGQANMHSNASHLLVRPVEHELSRPFKSLPSDTIVMTNPRNTDMNHHQHFQRGEWAHNPNKIKSPVKESISTTNSPIPDCRNISPLVPVSDSGRTSDGYHEQKVIMLLSGNNKPPKQLDATDVSGTDSNLENAVNSNATQAPLSAKPRGIEHQKIAVQQNLPWANKKSDVEKTVDDPKALVDMKPLCSSDSSSCRKDPPKKRPENRIIPVSVEESSQEETMPCSNTTGGEEENDGLKYFPATTSSASTVHQTSLALNHDPKNAVKLNSKVHSSPKTLYSFPKTTTRNFQFGGHRFTGIKSADSALNVKNNNDDISCQPYSTASEYHRAMYYQELQQKGCRNNTTWAINSGNQMYIAQPSVLVPPSDIDSNVHTFSYVSGVENLSETCIDSHPSLVYFHGSNKTSKLLKESAGVTAPSLIIIEPDQNNSPVQQQDTQLENLYLKPTSNIEIPAINRSLSLLNQEELAPSPVGLEVVSHSSRPTESDTEEIVGEKNMCYTMLETEAYMNYEMADQFGRCMNRHQSVSSNNEAMDLTMPKAVDTMLESHPDVNSDNSGTSTPSSQYFEVTSSVEHDEHYPPSPTVWQKMQENLQAKDDEIKLLKLKIAQLRNEITEITENNNNLPPGDRKRRMSTSSCSSEDDKVLKKPRIKVLPPDSSTFSVENQDYQQELMPESGVFIQRSKLMQCLLKSRDSPTMLMRFLLDVFFDTETLSNSSASGRGHAGRPALPAHITTPLIGFIRQRYSQCTDGDMIQAINQKCTDARKVIKKRRMNGQRNSL